MGPAREGLVRSWLDADGGRIYLNVITPPSEDAVSVRMDRTLRSVFGWCATKAVGSERKWHNRVYRCARREIDGDAKVYSDGDVRAAADSGRWRITGR